MDIIVKLIKNLTNHWSYKYSHVTWMPEYCIPCKWTEYTEQISPFYSRDRKGSATDTINHPAWHNPMKTCELIVRSMMYHSHNMNQAQARLIIRTDRDIPYQKEVQIEICQPSRETHVSLFKFYMTVLALELTEITETKFWGIWTMSKQ